MMARWITRSTAMTPGRTGRGLVERRVKNLSRGLTGERGAPSISQHDPARGRCGRRHLSLPCPETCSAASRR
jgi:hypothetical protein